MARPTKNDIDSGIQNWDGKIDDNDEALFNAPLPIHEHSGDETDLASTFAAALYDRCLVWVNHTTLGWGLYKSTGSAWELLQSPNSYDSGNQTITASALLTLAHGLGAVPDLITYTLVCLTAEHGYSIGDEVDFSTATITRASSTQAGLSVRKGSTNLLVRYGSDAKVLDGLLNATTGGTVNLTPASWALKVKAYIF